MITRLGMAPRLAGHSYEEFQHHWRTSHADAAGKIPNLLRYVQNHAVLQGGVPILGFPGFDACSELDFESVESMTAGFNSEEYQIRVRADERSFVEKSKFSSVLGRREVLVAGLRPIGGVKLMLFYRLHPRARVSDLLGVLRAADSDRLQDEGVCRREVLVPLESHSSDLGAPAAEIVDMHWFDDTAAALCFLQSSFYDEWLWNLAGISFGGARHLATEVDVVGPK